MHVWVCLRTRCKYWCQTQSTPITGLGGQCRRGANDSVHRSKHKSTPVSRLTAAYYLLLLWHTHTHTHTPPLNVIIGRLWLRLPLCVVSVTAIPKKKRGRKAHHMLLHKVGLTTHGSVYTCSEIPENLNADIY